MDIHLRHLGAASGQRCAHIILTVMSVGPIGACAVVLERGVQMSTIILYGTLILARTPHSVCRGVGPALAQYR